MVPDDHTSTESLKVSKRKGLHDTGLEALLWRLRLVDTGNRNRSVGWVILFQVASA